MTTIAEFRHLIGAAIPEIINLLEDSDEDVRENTAPSTKSNYHLSDSIDIGDITGAELKDMIDILGSDAASLSSAPPSAAFSFVHLPLGNVDANTRGGPDNVSYPFESGVKICA
jgi:hypothetical protein